MVWVIAACSLAGMALVAGIVLGLAYFAFLGVLAVLTACIEGL